MMIPARGKQAGGPLAERSINATVNPEEAPMGKRKAEQQPEQEKRVLIEEASKEEAEQDDEVNYAPEEALAEEERLRAAREKKAKQALQDVFNQEDGPLDKEAFAQLDQLISKTGVYSTFLTEQMQEVEERVKGQNGCAGTKRKASAQGASSNKKRKTDAGSASDNPTQQILPLIKGDLRDYQLKGVCWMIALYENGLNGILADQMGLGKTVQTIGFLSHIVNNGTNGPFMVLGPLSTLPNWVSEFKRWGPSIPTVLYHGSKVERADIRKRLMPSNFVHCPGTFPVVITSYEIVLADIKFLQKYQWKYIVVDEGHRLKNFNCKLLRELRTLHTANKLILSGTPLQNNLSELWSMLNFLMPDIFTSMSRFESWFDFSAIGQEGAEKDIAAKEQRNQVVSKLHALLKPFLLRRVKADVETSLPAKSEIILYADMSETQRKFNAQLRDRTLNEVLEKAAKDEGGRVRNAGKLNNMLMQMRKNANHPDLISSAFSNDAYYPTSAELRAECGKLALLDRLLVKLRAGGHKVLIFSQMTKMLDLLDTYLEQEGHHSCRLDGSVSWQDRQKAMADFNADPDLFVFLLSTRAGGLGINLTSADTCIIYDSDWNPHQDMQAMDRCHRIGQQKPVLVLRLATAHSVEGKMLRRANNKLMLERLVIKKGAFMTDNMRADKPSSMSADELMDLLKDTHSNKDEPQSGVISDEMLDRLLDRSHLVERIEAPYKPSGIGYEIVAQNDGSGLLSTVQ